MPFWRRRPSPPDPTPVANSSEPVEPREAGYEIMRSLFSDREYRMLFSPPRQRFRVQQIGGEMAEERARAESILRGIGALIVEPLVAAMNDVDRDKRRYHSHNADVRIRAHGHSVELGHLTRSQLWFRQSGIANTWSAGWQKKSSSNSGYPLLNPSSTR